MKYKNFPDDIWIKIKKLLNEKKSSQQTCVAAFDADGTLWDTDLGEAFFQWQIRNCPLVLPTEAQTDPWIYYRKMKSSGDPRPAYLWLAQINKGHSLSQVRQWADAFLDEIKPLPIFEAQKQLIQLLIENQVQVYIITASVKWAVEPGARLLGLANENVLGVSTAVDNKGLITDQGIFPITYKEGKLEALLKHTHGVAPILSAGNTTGDLYLLKGSQGLSIAVGATPRDHELFSTEEQLRQEALKNNWIIHHF